MGIIDYAGLFPPARLPLGEAIRNYAEYRRSRDAWMMSRFIIPAAKLQELNDYSDLFEVDPPFLFSVTSSGGKTPDEFLENLPGDIDHIDGFVARHGGRVSVDLLEVRLPVSGMTSDSILELLNRADTLLKEGGMAELVPYFEVNWSGDWIRDFDNATEALQGFNNDRARTHHAGFKLRCGGVQPHEVPESIVVATALDRCAAREVPFKATAGLHHPFRHWRGDYGGWMHGFVNVFFAGAIALKYHPAPKVLKGIIDETNADLFQFSDDGITCRDWKVSLDELASARKLFGSYGSCSFDEPREDLKAFGLL